MAASAPDLETDAPRAADGGADYSDGTWVVLLGTGTPNPEPHARGPATAIVVDGGAYLVDAGTGVVRRAAEAQTAYGIGGLAADQLDIVFLTHLHSDHTIGLPDLIHTSWVAERVGPLRVFGPVGTARMADHLTGAWRADIQNRLSGLQPSEPDGWRVETVEIGPGLVYEDSLVRVTAFAVPHTGWDESFGFRFETADRVIVLSGDTTPSRAVVDACAGCDVLVHEVYSLETWRTRPEEWRRYHAGAHTSTEELAAIAAEARPGLLVLHHQLHWGASPEEMLAEVAAAGYTGATVYGRDLDIY